MKFPDLLALEHNFHYSVAVQEGYASLRRAFERAQQILALNQLDPLRYQIHLDHIRRNVIPVLDVIHLQSCNEGIPDEWVTLVVGAFINVVGYLQQAVQSGSVK